MKSYLVANWKMHFNPTEAAQLATEFTSFTADSQDVQVWLAPTALCLRDCVESVRGKGIQIGAQNAHWQESGACTGEISVEMIKQLGAHFCLSGHSERRHNFGESNELVCRRTLGILETDFTVIHCVGETLQQRESGLTEQVLREQLDPVFSEVSDASNLVVAYEPVWAIGTGKVASLSEISDAHSFIQSLWQNDGSNCPPVLYGGSVKPENYADIIALPEVQGALVGGASLKMESFQALYEIAVQA